MAIDVAHDPDDEAAAQQCVAEPLGQSRAGPVVEDREAREDAARALERGGADRVHENEPRGGETARDGGRRDDRPERVPQHDGVRRRGGGEGREPLRIRGEVVRAPRKRRRLAEAGQIGRDHPHVGEMRDDRLEPVVLAAESVYGEDRRLRIGGSVDPVGRPPAEHLDLTTLDRDRIEQWGVGVRDGHA